MTKPSKKEKRIGIALGGGSCRGLAHIGVLKVFDNEKIPISFISGTSIGAIIGAAYSSGLKAEEIENLVLSTDFKELMDFTIPKRGLLSGRKLEKVMNKITREKNFDELLIPLSVVATDLEKPEKVILTKGNVARAIRASAAIPPFFTPVLIEGHQLVDGGLVDPVPISELKEMGSDIIIGVDISHTIKVIYDQKNDPKKTGFSHAFFEIFIKKEYDLAKDIFRRKKIKYLPRFIKRLLITFFDRFFNPKKIIRYLSGRQAPEILLLMLQQVNILVNQLTIERLKDKAVDLIIKPDFKDVDFLDFDRAKEIIKMGEEAAVKALPKIKKSSGK